MKRAPIVLGLFYLLAAVAAIYIGDWAFIAAGVLLGMSLLLFLIKPIRKCIPVYLLAIFAFGLGLFGSSVYREIKIEPFQAADGVEAFVSGTVYKTPEYEYGKYYYMLTDAVIKLDSTTLENAKIKISSYEDLDAGLTDVITGNCYLYLPENEKNLYAKGIQLSGYIKDSANVLSGEGKRFPCVGAYLQQWASKALDRYLTDEQAGMLKAILLGVKTDLSDEIYENFVNVGAAHLLAVSGQHLTMFLLFMTVILKKLRVHRTLQILISILSVLLFASAAGFSASIVRSGIMCLITLVGRLFYQESEGMNSLSVAVLFMCIWNPYTVFDLGFILSVVSTAGILLWERPIESRLMIFFRLEGKNRKLLNSAVTSFSMSLAATAAVFPVSLFAFGRLSWLAPIINILLLYPFTALLFLALLIAVLGNIPYIGVVSVIPAFAAKILIEIFTRLVNWLGQLPFIVLSVDFSFVKVWLGVTVLLIAIALFFKGGKLFRWAAVFVSCLTLIIGGIIYNAQNENVIEIYVSGNGDTSLIVTENKRGAVIGLGGYAEEEAEEVLFSKGIRRVESAVVLGAGYDEAARALALNEAYQVENIFMTDVYIDGYTETRVYALENTCAQSLTQERFLWDDITIECFKAEDTVAVMLKAGNEKILICSSGAELSLLPEDFLMCDYCVTSSVPKKAELLSCEALIFTGQETNYQSCLNQLKAETKAVCADTCDGITIRICGEETDLWGNHEWQM